jgi:hypothetical protein
MFSLLTLKIMLTIFYALIMIPYDYLNCLPLIVSVVIFYPESIINHLITLKFNSYAYFCSESHL